MNFLEHRFTLDVRRDASKVCVRVRKGDTARRLRIALVQGVVPYEIRSDCYAMFSAVKPDGNRLFNPCTIEDNRIVYELTPQTTAVIGLVECEIRLYGADDALITSPGFDLIVDEVLYDEDKVPQSETEVNALTGLISDAAEVIAEGRELIGEFGSALGQIEGIRDEAKAAAEAASKRQIAATKSAAASEKSAQDAATQALAAAESAKQAQDANAGIGQSLEDAEAAREGAVTAAGDAARSANEAKTSEESAVEAAGVASEAANSAQNALSTVNARVRAATEAAVAAGNSAKEAESVLLAAEDAKNRAETAITRAEEATAAAEAATAIAEEAIDSVQQDRLDAEAAAKQAKESAQSINTQLAEDLAERVGDAEEEIAELKKRPGGGFVVQPEAPENTDLLWIDPDDEDEEIPSDTPGGYYIPIVTQPDANSMQVAYTPSADGMPSVAPVQVMLPAGPKGNTGGIGPQGPAGDNGTTPHIGDNGNWWIGEEDTGVSAGGAGGGGGENWEKINEFTLEENALTVLMDADFDGKPFELKKMQVYMYLPKCKNTSGEDENTGYACFRVNGVGAPYQNPSSDWDNNNFVFSFEAVGNYITVSCLKGIYNRIGAKNDLILWHTYKYDNYDGKIRSFLWSTFSPNANKPSAMAGASFEVWGVRV